MKYKYIHIFSFVAALLMLATFSACEADDKIVFVTGTTTEPEPEFKLPILPNPGEGKTTVVLYVPENTKSCYAVGTVNGWNIDNTEYTFTSIQGTDDKRWVACTFDYAEDMRIKVLAVPYDPNMSLGWSFQWGKNMDPANDLEENNVIILDGEGELGTENGGQVFLYYSTSANNSVTYIQIKSWEMSPTFENGHEWVDLGLSVKWATCNVGASSPKDYGDYFAWGETEPKEVYDWSTYKYCNGSYDSLTKYNTSSSRGTIVDNKTQLELTDDAARANWGGRWRMPTDVEMTELRINCAWKWTSQNGVNGYRVTSKSNGNSIFLPVAGYRRDSSLNFAGSYGNYRSSSLDTDNPHNAYDMMFSSSYVDQDDSNRCCGLSVRPVLGEYVAETNIPVVVTSAITQITETSAVAGGTVTSDGGASVIEHGVVYSTNPNPVITNLSNTIRPCGSGTGEFTYTITDLQPNTTYYLRAYAKNDAGTAYGEEVNFTTEDIAISEPTGIENGYGYVDLGLSVKWATMNVGASKPEGYGDCFAWGEVTAKTTYDWSTYKWCNGSYDNLTRYNNSSVYGTVDNKTQLAFSDDAAFKNWGGSWRMPTDAEWTELREQCTWIWTTESGVYGYKVISKTNSNSIFLSAAGYYYDSSLFSANDGYYWSSSLSTDYPGYAWGVSFSSSNVNRRSSNRYCGQSVRPVCP